jgi:hypothetical protein
LGITLNLLQFSFQTMNKTKKLHLQSCGAEMQSEKSVELLQLFNWIFPKSQWLFLVRPFLESMF